MRATGLETKMHLGARKFAVSMISAWLLAFVSPAQAEDRAPWPAVQSNPLVIELYTSQGCLSCPPADMVLDQLADLPGVLALAFHVDYWDYIGWKDPFATPVATKRQKYYRHVLDNRYIYTPQFIIGGDASPNPANESLFDRDLMDGAGEATLMLTSDERGILFPVTDNLSGPADLWLVHFDERHKTNITQGENAGRELQYRHVVREIRHLGDWHGEERLLHWPEKVRYGAALIVQNREEGTILATMFTMN
ncbi:MAG: DUF1223 domain-containing protein [Rhodospirillaceae bacterium]|nr:DUF1223 domain-containing protein [Rhodospirillaceae bacterium]